MTSINTYQLSTTIITILSSFKIIVTRFSICSNTGTGLLYPPFACGIFSVL